MINQPISLKMLELGDLLFQKHQNSQIVIKDYFILNIGQTPYTKNPAYYENGTIKWINSGVLTNFLTDKIPPSCLITEKAAKERKLVFTKNNSVLLSLIGWNISWCQSNNYTFNQSIVNFQNERQLDNATLYFSFRQVNFKNYANGCIFKALTKHGLLNMKINWVSNPVIQQRLFNLLNSHV